MFRQSDIIKMAKRRGYDIKIVSDNIYMLKKNSEDYWHKVNGHGAVHTMAPVYYRFRVRKR
jgi:hypothetical protein